MKVELYPDSGGLWRWRLRAANGKITADGAEGYANVSSVRRAVRRLFNVLMNGPLRVIEVAR